jgi:AcrR family transcriptional regulator
MSPAARRRRTSTAKREAVEADLVRAVNELLAEGASYTDLDIGRIAERAGISRTAFYFYFADKRELLIRMTEGVMGLLYEQAEGWWSGTGSAPANLETALRTAAALYRDNAAILCAIVEVSGYDDEVGAFWRGVIGRFEEATSARLEHEWGAGAHSPSARATAFSLSWMTERVLYQSVVQDGEVDREELVDALVAVWQSAVYSPR